MFGTLAQRYERLAYTEDVVGSIPTGLTNYGRLPEWSNGARWKRDGLVTVTGVQILYLPPTMENIMLVIRKTLIPIAVLAFLGGIATLSYYLFVQLTHMM